MASRFVLREVILNEGDRAKSVSLVVADLTRVSEGTLLENTLVYSFPKH